MKEKTQVIELTQDEANALYLICDVALKAQGIEALGAAATILMKLQKKPEEKAQEVEEIARN
jgi:hypothetical protein